MEIKIYQINTDRDDNGCAFMNMDWLKKQFGDTNIDCEIYDRVYSGEITGETLEDVFCTFNFERPAGFNGHSLSVSDVVEIVESDSIEPGFYFCDSIGFKQITFDTSRVPEKEDKIRVVLLEPGKLAKVAEIDSSL